MCTRGSDRGESEGGAVEVAYIGLRLGTIRLVRCAILLRGIITFFLSLVHPSRI